MKALIHHHIEKVIFIFFSLLPCIDSLNGYLVTTFDISIGILYKLVLSCIIFMIWLLFVNVKKELIIKIVFPFLYIFLVIIINYFLSIGQKPLTDLIIKLLFNISLFYSLMDLIQNKLIDSKLIDKILLSQSILIIMCILVPYFLGIGYYSYHGNLGFKGFFFSLNELNATILILFFYNIYNLANSNNNIYRITTPLIFICLILMSSKSSILGGGFGIIFYLYCLFKKKKINLTKKRITILFTILLGFLIIILPFVSDFLIRQISLFNNFSGNIFSTITSGRNLLFIRAIEELSYDKYCILKFFIGNGFFSTFLIEMDLLDMFVYLGIFGMLGCIYFFYRLMLLSIKNNNHILRIVGLSMIYLFSFFTGHVIFTATAGIYFVLFCMYNLYC